MNKFFFEIVGSLAAACLVLGLMSVAHVGCSSDDPPPTEGGGTCDTTAYAACIDVCLDYMYATCITDCKNTNRCP